MLLIRTASAKQETKMLSLADDSMQPDLVSATRILPLIANALVGIGSSHGLDWELYEIMPRLVVEAFTGLLCLLPLELQEALAQQIGELELEQRMRMMTATVESVPELYPAIITKLGSSLGDIVPCEPQAMAAQADARDFLVRLGASLQS
jgi:hypothetical protein